MCWCMRSATISAFPTPTWKRSRLAWSKDDQRILFASAAKVRATRFPPAFSVTRPLEILHRRGCARPQCCLQVSGYSRTERPPTPCFHARCRFYETIIQLLDVRFYSTIVGESHGSRSHGRAVQAHQDFNRCETLRPGGGIGCRNCACS